MKNCRTDPQRWETVLNGIWLYRIKAVLIDAAGKSGWLQEVMDGRTVWKIRFGTYSLTDIKEGLQDCYAKLKQDVQEKYGETLKRVVATDLAE